MSGASTWSQWPASGTSSSVTLEEIPGAGHWVHVDAPEETFTAVERALKE